MRHDSESGSRPGSRADRSSVQVTDELPVGLGLVPVTRPVGRACRASLSGDRFSESSSESESLASCSRRCNLQVATACDQEPSRLGRRVLPYPGLRVSGTAGSAVGVRTTEALRVSAAAHLTRDRPGRPGAPETGPGPAGCPEPRAGI